MDRESIERAWAGAVGFVELYGWRLLGLAIVAYVAQQKYRTFAARRYTQRALREANDPERVAILQQETARIRAEQQRRLAETLPRRKAPAITTKKVT